MKFLTKSIGIMLIASVSLASCSLNSESPGQQTSSSLPIITLGVIAPMSGPAAAYGEEVRNMLTFEAERMNAESAKLGYQVKLVFEDGKCDGGGASVAFEKLVEVDGVDGIIGGMCSSESLAIIPLLNAKKNIIAFTPYSSNPDLEGKSPYFFSASYNDRVMGEGVAKELGKYHSVAILTEQNDYNEGVRKVVLGEIEKKYPSTKVILDERFEKGGTSFRNVLEKIRNSGAEVLYLNPNAWVTAESLIRQLGEMPDWKPKIVTTFPAMTPDIRSKFPSVAEGAVYFDAPGITDEKFLAYQSQIRVKELAGYFTAAAIDTLRIFASLESKHRGDADSIRKELSTREYSGWLGTIRFDNHTFIQNISAARYEVRDGKALQTN